METLIVASIKAVRSLFTPGMLSVFILSLIITAAALLGFVGIATAFFVWLSDHMGGLIGHSISWMGSTGAVFAAWFMFPGIMPVIVSFFDYRIAHVIESQEYANTQPLHVPHFWPEFLHDLRFSGVALGLNIVVLPLYLIPGLGQILFYWLNGYLLGREFFVMVGRRHIPVHEAEALRKRYGWSIMLVGAALTLMATIPLANFIAPFWGIAVMVHLFHRLCPPAERPAQPAAAQILPPEQPKILF